MISIYVLKTEAEGVRYVGMTRDPKRREDQYRRLVKGHTRHLKNWINKVGDALIFEVIETVPDDIGDVCERKWIAFYRHLGVRLINYTSGGEGGFTLPPEACAKIGAASKARFAKIKTELGYIPGRPWTEESRRRLSEAKRGKPCPWNAVRNRAQTGIPLSAEHKRKMSEAVLGRKRSEASKALDRINAKRKWEDPEIVEKMLVGCRRGGADPAGRIASAEKRRGVALTEEHRKKVSEGMKGKKHPGVAAYWARWRAAKAAEAPPES